jgi:hypothetical protein
MSNLDIGKDIRFIFCDISKAFDRVWHTGLLYKLRKIGIDGNLLTWNTDYLDDRKQKVVLDEFSSGWEVQRCIIGKEFNITIKIINNIVYVYKEQESVRH